MRRYVTSGRDGTVRFWNGEDLSFWRSVNNGPSWVTGMAYLPLHNTLVTSTVDRCLTYYNVQRSSCELTGRLYCLGAALP